MLSLFFAWNIFWCPPINLNVNTYFCRRYPPESLGIGATPFRFESDIWSLGVTYWEIFSNKFPEYIIGTNVRLNGKELKEYLKKGERLSRKSSNQQGHYEYSVPEKVRNNLFLKFLFLSILPFQFSRDLFLAVATAQFSAIILRSWSEIVW